MSGIIGMFGLPGLILSLVVAVGLCVHAVRTHQDTFWLWVILIFQPIGGLVYIIAILLPQMFGGTTARKLSKATRETLDPGRNYRDAKAAHELTPTVHNQMRLAAASAELGRWDDAETLYAQAMQGVHEDDPALLLGRARALIELGRHQEALDLLEKLPGQGTIAIPPQGVLAFARAYEGLGRDADAEAAFVSATERVPGMEGIARHAAFLARIGRRAEAQELLNEIDKRSSRATAHFRREARAWRDFAARALG